MNHGWQSEATDGPRAAKRKESAKRKKSADRSGKYFSISETWTVECNCRRIFANIWFSHVWKHSSYTYAIPWCFKIWAWLRHEFLETAIPWWFTSKFWPRHELGMSLSFGCTWQICNLECGFGNRRPTGEAKTHVLGTFYFWNNLPTTLCANGLTLRMMQKHHQKILHRSFF